MAHSKANQSVLAFDLMGNYLSTLDVQVGAKTLQEIHADIRLGGISLTQVRENGLLFANWIHKNLANMKNYTITDI